MKYQEFKSDFLQQCNNLVKSPSIMRVEYDHGKVIITHQSWFNMSEWGCHPTHVYYGSNPVEVMKQANELVYLY